MHSSTLLKADKTCQNISQYLSIHYLGGVICLAFQPDRRSQQASGSLLPLRFRKVDLCDLFVDRVWSVASEEAVSQSSREGTSENDARQGKGGQTFLLGLVMSIAAGVCCWRNLSSSFPDISTRNDIDTSVSKNNDNGHILVFRGRFCPACVV
jgi:hypothetical protein